MMVLAERHMLILSSVIVGFDPPFVSQIGHLEDHTIQTTTSLSFSIQFPPCPLIARSHLVHT